MPEAPVNSFDDISDRLDDIVEAVRSKDTSLERSLDLFDEAIKLGSRAVEMVDQFDLSPREEALLDAEQSAGDSTAAADAAPAGASAGEENAVPTAPRG